MKKLFFAALALLLSATAMADDVQKVDGSKLVRMTFDGDNVTLHYQDGTTETADMADIVIDMSNVTTSVETAQKVARLKDKQVYTPDGRLAGTGVEGLAKGLYVVEGKKVIIK